MRSRVRRAFVVCSLLPLLIALNGCALVEIGKDITRKSVRQFSPKTNDYADDVNYGDPDMDEWQFVGKEGRGELPREKESDGLTKWISSPKARSIEKNLGYD